MNTDNIDKFGHCVICHKNLIEKRVVDGKLEEVFMAIHGETEFLLDNGSRMNVCMCKPCQQLNNLQDSNIHKNIMEAVHKGWQLETKLLVDNKTWIKEHGEKYLDIMSKRNINCHSQHLSHSVLNKRIKEITNVYN